MMSCGGGGENRTRVQKLSIPASTCVANSLSSYRQPCKLAMPVAGQLLSFAPAVTTPAGTSSYDMSLLSLARTGCSVSPEIKRRERNAHRWRLYFCKRFSEELTPRHASKYLMAPVETRSPPRGLVILLKTVLPVKINLADLMRHPAQLDHRAVS